MRSSPGSPIPSLFPKRARKGDGCLRERKDGRLELIHHYRDENDLPHDKSFCSTVKSTTYELKKAEVEGKRDDFERKRLSGALPKSPNMRLGQLLDFCVGKEGDPEDAGYFCQINRRTDSDGIKDDRRMAAVHLAPLRMVKLSMLQTPAIDAVILDLIGGSMRSPKHAPRAQKVRSLLKVCIDVAKAKGWFIGENPVSLALFPVCVSRKEDLQPYDFEQIIRLMDACLLPIGAAGEGNLFREEYEKALAELRSRGVGALSGLVASWPRLGKTPAWVLTRDCCTAICTRAYVAYGVLGLRANEVAGLLRKDYNLSSWSTGVHRQRDEESTKTRKGKRTIVAAPFCVEAIEAHLDCLRYNPLAADSEWMFPSWSKKGVSESRGTVRDRVQAAMKRAGLPALDFHDLRHTSASLMVVEDVVDTVRRDILGHENVDIGKKIYTHTMMEQLYDAAEKMQRGYDRALGKLRAG